MKNIFILILTLILFTSCDVNSDISSLSESVILTFNQNDNDEIDKSFFEDNLLLEDNLFSVNELSEMFGEVSFVDGYYNEKYEYYVISVMFKDVKFDLAANSGEELNFTPIKDSIYYEVPDSALDIKLKLQYVSIFSGDWSLPKGVKLGDSVEMLYNAYNGDSGEERFAQGEFLVSYSYGESGNIEYHFDENKINGIKQATISLYHNDNKDNSLQSKIAPLP